MPNGWLIDVVNEQRLNAVLPRFELNIVSSRFQDIPVTLRRLLAGTSHPLGKRMVAGVGLWNRWGRSCF